MAANSGRIRVSVIMACFNSAAYLDEAVNSVLGQSLSDVELILIDDASTDDTLERAKGYSRKDKRVTVVPLPVNSGPAGARNAGIDVANGEWLGILDSDDVALPDRFEEQLRVAGTNDDLVLIGSDFVSIDERGAMIKEHRYPTRHGALVKRLVTLQGFPPHSSMMYRAEAVRRLGGFDKKFESSEDYDLWVRLSEVGRISSVGRCLARIRKHTDNISNADDGRLQLTFGIAASACHFLRACGYPEPSAADDGAAWKDFLSWIQRRLDEERELEKFKRWNRGRAVYLSQKNRLIGALRFGSQLLESRYAGQLLWRKGFGTTLPRFLASEWMARPRAASQAWLR